MGHGKVQLLVIVDGHVMDGNGVVLNMAFLGNRRGLRFHAVLARPGVMMMIIEGWHITIATVRIATATGVVVVVAAGICRCHTRSGGKPVSHDIGRGGRGAIHGHGHGMRSHGILGVDDLSREQPGHGAARLGRRRVVESGQCHHCGRFWRRGMSGTGVVAV